MQEIGHLIDPVSTAARGEAAQLGHKVMVTPYITLHPLDLQQNTFVAVFSAVVQSVLR